MAESSVINDRYELHTRSRADVCTEVYIANDLVNNRPVTLTLIKCGAESAGAIRKLVDSLSRINHPNTSKPLEYIEQIVEGTEYINYGRATKEALQTLPQDLHRKAQIKLARLGAVTSMQDLQEIRGNRFEKLKGKRKGQFSIRINDQYRICFKWEKENASDVEIIDYH